MDDHPRILRPASMPSRLYSAVTVSSSSSVPSHLERLSSRGMSAPWTAPLPIPPQPSCRRPTDADVLAVDLAPVRAVGLHPDQDQRARGHTGSGGHWHTSGSGRRPAGTTWPPTVRSRTARPRPRARRGHRPPSDRSMVDFLDAPRSLSPHSTATSVFMAASVGKPGLRSHRIECLPFSVRERARRVGRSSSRSCRPGSTP